MTTEQMTLEQELEAGKEALALAVKHGVDGCLLHNLRLLEFVDALRSKDAEEIASLKAQLEETEPWHKVLDILRIATKPPALSKRLLELDSAGYSSSTGAIGAEAATTIARLESQLAEAQKNMRALNQRLTLNERLNARTPDVEAYGAPHLKEE